MYVSENMGTSMAPAALRIVSPDDLVRQEDADAKARVAAEEAANENSQLNTSLVAFIDNKFSTFMRHRDGANGWTDRLVTAMRVFAGQYEPQKLAEIKKFGGSEIYARLVATKCRGATSLLRDVYLNTEKPWGLQATPDPTLPEDIAAAAVELVQSEAQNAALSGAQITPEMIRDRLQQILGGAARAALKKARTEAETAFRKVDDILTEGGFYEALSAFLVDLPLFPFACMKGPVVRIVPEVTWVDGQAVLSSTVGSEAWNSRDLKSRPH